MKDIIVLSLLTGKRTMGTIISDNRQFDFNCTNCGFIHIIIVIENKNQASSIVVVVFELVQSASIKILPILRLWLALIGKFFVIFY